MNNIFDDFLEMIQDDEALINDLLEIDNDINSSNITYEELYNAIANVLSQDNKITIKKDSLFVTEGNPLITVAILKNIVNYFDYNYVLFINEGYVGINSYLVKKFKLLVGDSINIELDTNPNYNKYIRNKKYKAIPIGEKALVDAVLNDFN